MNHGCPESDAYAIGQSIWRYLQKRDGYQPFGYDWRTLRQSSPRIAAVLTDCYVVLGLPTS